MDADEGVPSEELRATPIPGKPTIVDPGAEIATTLRADPVVSAWLDASNRLRATAIACTADYFRHLLESEEDPRLQERWQRAGVATYADLLRLTERCDVSLYEKFKLAVAQFGHRRVREIGVQQASVLMQVPGDAESRRSPGVPAREAAIAEVEAARDRQGSVGVPQVHSIARKHFDRERPSLPRPTTDERIAALESENAALRKENARLVLALARASERLETFETRSRE